MLDFFSKKLGVPYPWPKYSQVVVRDYVSGAMENTSAVIFGDFVQKKKRELIDNNNDKIVAHEMFHHWFGDLVTCESWANLTMNEGCHDECFQQVEKDPGDRRQGGGGGEPRGRNVLPPESTFQQPALAWHFASDASRRD